MKNNYINKNEFNKLFEDTDSNYDLIIDNFIKIIKGVSNRFKFRNRMDYEDCRQLAFIMLLKKMNEFNPELDCFNFATTIIFNEFKRYIYLDKHFSQLLSNYGRDNRKKLSQTDKNSDQDHI